MANLISSNTVDYQEFLMQAFLRFLIAQKASQKTRVNYIGDIKQFLNWLINSSQPMQKPFSSHLELLKSVSRDLIENYKRSMLLEHVPVATLNRRLSALRIFFRCVMNEGWLPDSPMESIANIPKDVTLDSKDLTKHVQNYLESNFIPDSDTQITERVNLTEFIDWLTNSSPTSP